MQPSSEYENIEKIDLMSQEKTIANPSQGALQASRDFIELAKNKEAAEKAYTEASRKGDRRSVPIGQIREEFDLAQKQFSEKAPQYLQAALGLSESEKVEFVINYINGASYHEFSHGGQVRGNQDLRLLRLRELLDSIPNDKVDDEMLGSLIDVDQKKYSGDRPVSLGEKIVSVLKQSDIERASTLFPKLPIRYQAEILSDREMNVSRTFVDEWISQLDIKPRHGSGANTPLFDAIATSIKHWPADEQYQVVHGVVTRGDLWSLGLGKEDDIPSFIKLAGDWPQELSSQFINIDNLMVQDASNLIETECRVNAISIAMSNWKAEDVDQFLEDATSIQLGNKDKDDIKLKLLKHRTAELEETMQEWIKEGVTGFSREALSLLENRPSYITPDISSEFFSSYNSSRFSLYDARFELRSYLTGYLKELTPEEKVAYIDSFSEILKIKTLDKQEIDGLKTDIAKWDQEHLHRLTELLFDNLDPTKESEDYSHKNPQANNAEWAVSQLNKITNPELVKQIIRLKLIDKGDHPVIQAAIDKIPDNPEMQVVVRSSAIDCALKYLMDEDFWEVKSIVDAYSLGQLSELKDNLPAFLQSMVANFNMETFDDLSDFIRTDNGREYYDYLKLTPDRPALLSREDILLLPKTPLNIVELEAVKQGGIDPDALASGEFSDWKALFKAVSESVPEWKDEQSILNPFINGAEIFGYKQMFDYMNIRLIDPQTHQPTSALVLTRHDALHAFGDVIALYESSELEANEFYNNVLQQVTMDGSEYSEGTAHHHLNSIAQTANPNIGEIICKAQEYSNIERLQELAATFDSPQVVFSSWANLKRYSELEQLLGRTEIIEELKELKLEGKDALYHYVETLAFHPDSKVNMEAVIQFWRNPEYFLAADASHTPYEVQNRKKPSNYINMPNLDLTALELRDALVEGDLDAIQTFSPLEIKYKIPVESYEPRPFIQVVSEALGSRKEGVQGAARNPGKLFSELNALLKEHGTNVVSYLGGEQIPNTVDFTQLEKIVYNQDFGMERPQIQTREFVARISRKSDPEGAIAGDDTVNCMPFGDGKNTVYTFNPNTAQFVIRVIKGDGKERTIAQSVLTKDMDIKTHVPDVISKLDQVGSHLEAVLPEDILRNAPTYIAADNVEVSPNFSDQRHQEIIAAIMRDYFREYMSRYSEEQGLEPTKVPIGQGYTDALSELPTAPNTYAPQAPVSYSDKTGEKVYMLDLSSEDESNIILDKAVTAPEMTQNVQPNLPDITGIDYLTFEDALRVGYLEGKAYADNKSLMQFLFNMENALIAKDINNSAKNRPNMSLKYTDSEGKMSGYFLSWEGRLTDEYVQYNASEYYDQPCVYMMDLATDLENRMAGGRLIRAFTELYKQNYLDKDNPIPIFAQARETTSFRIIQRQLERLGREAGTEFELIELPTYDEGEDTMHPVIIQPKVSLA